MNSIKIKILWLVILSPFITLFFMIQLAIFGFFGELPTFEQLENPSNNLATEIISEDGEVLGKYFFENRSKVRFHELPQNLIDALLATEDVRFRSHSGIDFRALMRASYGAVLGAKNSGGASTITQQLAKMLFTEKPSSGIERVLQKKFSIHL